MNELVNIAGSRGLKVSAAPVPTAVETLEHLEQTLDSIDPIDTRSDADKAADEAAARMIAEGGPAVPEGTLDAAADAVIADITGDPSVEAIEAPAPDDTGSLAEIGHE